MFAKRVVFDLAGYTDTNELDHDDETNKFASTEWSQYWIKKIMNTSLTIQADGTTLEIYKPDGNNKTVNITWENTGAAKKDHTHSDYVTHSELEAAIAGIDTGGGGTVDLTGYATESYVQSSLNGYATEEYVQNYVANHSTTGSLESHLINGTSFNSTADITTSKWGTARSITIGNTTKSVDGSENVAWTADEIGISSSSADPEEITISKASLTNLTFTISAYRVGRQVYVYGSMTGSGETKSSFLIASGFPRPAGATPGTQVMENSSAQNNRGFMLHVNSSGQLYGTSNNNWSPGSSTYYFNITYIAAS